MSKLIVVEFHEALRVLLTKSRYECVTALHVVVIATCVSMTWTVFIMIVQCIASFDCSASVALQPLDFEFMSLTRHVCTVVYW